MFKKIAIYLAIMALPVVTFADKLSRTQGLLEAAKNIVNDILIPLTFTLALLYFFWGVVKYIKSEGQGKAEGKSIMIWGVVALFVISSIWGLVRFISEEFGINNSDSNMEIPSIGSGGLI